MTPADFLAKLAAERGIDLAECSEAERNELILLVFDETRQTPQKLWPQVTYNNVPFEDRRGFGINWRY